MLVGGGAPGLLVFRGLGCSRQSRVAKSFAHREKSRHGQQCLDTLRHEELNIN